MDPLKHVSRSQEQKWDCSGQIWRALSASSLESHKLHNRPTTVLRILYQRKECCPGLKGTEKGQKEGRIVLRAEQRRQRPEMAQTQRVGPPPPFQRVLPTPVQLHPEHRVLGHRGFSSSIFSLLQCGHLFYVCLTSVFWKQVTGFLGSQHASSSSGL